MALNINTEIPNIDIITTMGEINTHEWIENCWGIIFSHPKDFTPVCTTELGELAKLQQRFLDKNTKIMGVSIDPIEDHLNWINDINEVNNCNVMFPLIADENLRFSKAFDMLISIEQL
jgi:alkyl hydroperoxide reductase subunit AhpC